MTQLIYRGVAYDPEKNKVEERIVRRPQLFYRGVAHNGVKTLEQNRQGAHASPLFYRGVRLA
jgi:Domain of unknown function (DUF4278)